MTFLSVLKNIPARLSITIFTVLMASPAFADGFQQAENLIQKIGSTLMGTLAVATLTVATCWIGYKVLWDGRSLQDCKNIIIGGILIGGASAFASYILP